MRVVVSFTTIPSRIDRIGLMLDSVNNQTYKPDRIVLWMPVYCMKEASLYNLSDSTLQLLSNYNIEVGKCGTDWGPATKLIPTLFEEKDPDTILITLDDDVVYDPHTVEELVSASEKYPNESLGLMGGLPGPNGTTIFAHAEELPKFGLDFLCVGGLGGYRGILYRRRFFDNSVVEELTELMLQGAFVTDDQLFGWNLARRGIRQFVVKTQYIGPNGMPNFRFLNLGGGIYDGDSIKLADECIKRLEVLYRQKGWKI